MIAVESLTRRFGPVTAVDAVSFRLERGEVVGFLGPNGAGKTTTMRILTGYLPASAGRAEIAGFDVFRRSLEVRRRIGYLPESVPLYREHRVVEMLDFQGRLHGLPRPDRRRRLGEVLARVGMAEHCRTVIGTLSKGQRQRVGLAVALLPDPEVLILDEPTSGLDPLQRIEVRSLLRELARERTVLLSSHILPEVEAVCPRVIILHRGRIAADGTQDELVRQLGSESRVSVEIELESGGEAVAAARGALAALPGAGAARDQGGAGGWWRFEVPGPPALREEVGALARTRGWRLRELSHRAPALEELFARIALELDAAEGTPARRAAETGG
ncbi:MAG: ABC transporter ATP-binding protein [Planctomycetota bacterium]